MHEFESLAELYKYSTQKYAKRPALDFLGGDQTYSYEDIAEKCTQLTKLLCNFGIRPYDKIALFSQNMPNWTVAFFTIVAFGRIAVPMLPGLSANEVSNILTHSDSKVLFVSRKLLPKVSEEILAGMQLVICTDDLSILRQKDEEYTCDGQIAYPQPDDLAAIIYTSGTTGAAKGVMLSHRNLCQNITASWYTYHVNKRDVFLSILPMAHTYEMSIGMLYPFSRGAKVVYIQKPPTPAVLIPAFRQVRPTTVLTVPLIIEKIYRSSVLPTIRKSTFLSWLDSWAPKLLARLVGHKLIKTFGGRLKFFGVGGSKMDIEVEKFLRKAKFPYAIGYGLTETAPLICTAGPKVTRLGAAGKAAHGVKVRLDNVNPETGEGEIVTKGPHLMRGYYKDYTRTLAVMTEDGWFRTGDLATVDKKGRYSIKGRIGNLILGPSGENIYPEEIEGVINNMDGIAESLVVERDGHLVALVQLNENVLDWNLEGQDKFIIEAEKLQKNILEYVNSKVNRNSRIGEVQLQKEPFVKTATNKIRRFLYSGKGRNNRVEKE